MARMAVDWSGTANLTHGLVPYPMKRDQLYLLKPGFEDNGKRFYCPDCAELSGLVAYYPILKARLDVRTIDFPRPRTELVAKLGEQNQSCPVLILDNPPRNLPAHIEVRHANNRQFIAGARRIAEYFAHAHGIDLPH